MQAKLLTFSFIALRLAHRMAFTYPCPRKLREIMKMSMIEREPAHVICNIWKDYHSVRPANICSVLTKDKYQFIKNAGAMGPLFVLPVFRKGGHFKLISQWQQDCFLGTYLEYYLKRGTNAQPYVVFTLFTELLFSKGLVLVRGDVINNSLTKNEAEDLWLKLERSYTQEDMLQLVDHFNNQPQLFDEAKYNQSFGIPS